MKVMAFKTPGLSSYSQPIRHVGIVVFEGAILADVVDVTDVFGICDKLLSSIYVGETGYAISLLSWQGGIVKSSASVQIMTSPLPSYENHSFDTLLIVSGTGNFDVYRDPDLLAWLKKMQGNIRRIAAICTGVFVIAAAGLLDNRRATTHWALQDKLIQEFPHIKIDRDAAITEDEGIFTASDIGMAADLALHFLEQDLGPCVAKRVAENLLISPRRKDNFNPAKSPSRKAMMNKDNKIQLASRWLAEHLAEPINIPAVANFVSMSERNFQRQFKRGTGWTPHEFLIHLRLEAVRQQLAETDLPVDKIARRCGFLSGEHVARLFRKHMSISPCEYRKNERSVQQTITSSEPSPVHFGSNTDVLYRSELDVRNGRC